MKLPIIDLSGSADSRAIAFWERRGDLVLERDEGRAGWEGAIAVEFNYSWRVIDRVWDGERRSRF